MKENIKVDGLVIMYTDHGHDNTHTGNIKGNKYSQVWGRRGHTHAQFIWPANIGIAASFIWQHKQLTLTMYIYCTQSIRVQ